MKIYLLEVELIYTEKEITEELVYVVRKAFSSSDLRKDFYMNMKPEQMFENEIQEEPKFWSGNERYIRMEDITTYELEVLGA